MHIGYLHCRLYDSQGKGAKKNYKQSSEHYDKLNNFYIHLLFYKFVDLSLINLFIGSLQISDHTLYLTSTLATSPHQREKKISLWKLQCITVSPPVYPLVVEAVVHHSEPPVYRLVPTSLLANVHCNDSLVWWEASGFVLFITL